MFTYKETTHRYVWDIYAELAAPAFIDRGISAQAAAEAAANFADEMCRQRMVRFPPKDAGK